MGVFGTSGPRVTGRAGITFVVAVVLSLSVGASAATPADGASAQPGKQSHATAKKRPKPPYALRVLGRTPTSITLRWRARAATQGRFVVYRNRRVVARIPRSSFTFRRLRCGTRYVVGVQRSGSRIAAVPVRTRACAGPAGGATPPGTFPWGSGGNGLPARLPVSTGAVFHVATSGSDGNNGSQGAPWRTIGKAVGTLAPGQSAVVHAGVYNESVWTRRSGTAAAPITIRSAPGEAAPILRAGSAPYALTLASGARYMRFQGIVFEGASGATAANVTIENGSGQFEFLGVEIRGASRFGLYTEEQTSGVQVIASRIHDNGGSGPSGQDHNVYLMGTDHVVASSLIADAPRGYGIQVYPSNTRGIIAANTIVGNATGGIIVGTQGSAPTSGVRVIGNILAFNGGWGLSTYWGGSQGSDNIVRRNLAFGNATGGITGTAISVQGTVAADPRFVNRGGGDLRLADGSPAIGVGEAAFTPATDVVGGGRPQGTGPDLGAHER